MTQPETSQRPTRLASATALASDARLSRRAARRDTEAFEAIFRRYHQELYRFCLSMLGNPEDARDALQNTMVKALRALPGEEREIRLKPWLYRVARNESVDLIRKRHDSRGVDAELADPGEGLADAVASRERLRQLLRDLADLPERQRAALTMRELAGLSFAQIGEAFDTSAAVARQTVYEARLSLRGMEQGREMTCEEVMHRLSNADGRVSRRRDIRAHLRACTDCRAFRDGIDSRRRDFGAIAPLPAVVAAGVLHGALGGVSSASGAVTAGAAGGGAAGAASGSAGGAAVAASAGKAVTAGLVAKSVATVAVVAAVGVTAADRSGLIHTGLTDGSGKSTPAKVEKSGGAGSPSTSSGSGASPGGVRSDRAKGAARAKAHPKQHGGKGRAEHGAARSHAAPSHHGHETAAAHRHGAASHGQGSPRATPHSPTHESPSGSASPPATSGGAPSHSPSPPPPTAPSSEGGGGPPVDESSPEIEQPSGSAEKNAETQAKPVGRP